MTKASPRIGDVAWEVEWCFKIAIDDNGDVDFDRCEYATDRAETESQAESIAMDVYPQAIATIGKVDYREIRYTASGWEYTGNNGHYAGDDQP